MSNTNEPPHHVVQTDANGVSDAESNNSPQRITMIKDVKSVDSGIISSHDMCQQPVSQSTNENMSNEQHSSVMLVPYGSLHSNAVKIEDVGGENCMSGLSSVHQYVPAEQHQDMISVSVTTLPTVQESTGSPSPYLTHTQAHHHHITPSNGIVNNPLLYHGLYR